MVCLLMLFNTSVDYMNGRLMGAYPARKKLFVTISIVCDLAILGFFKYFNFGLDNYNATMAARSIPEAQYLGFLRVVLPLGISFYTFQSMSYVIDVYRGNAKVVTNFIDYACYVSMFPQLVAGPIIRFQDVADQLRERTLTWEKFARGTSFFMLGMAKKVLLANPCGKIADTTFNTGDLSCFDAWYGEVAYAFQIYFDFSGYSDMAIGLGENLAAALGMPVERIAFKGSAAAAVRTNLYRKTAKDAGWIKGKKFVIWCFSAREFTESTSRWPKVPVLKK